MDVLPADVYADENDTVWMSRTCKEHGEIKTYVWPDAKHYEWLRAMHSTPTAPKVRDAQIVAVHRASYFKPLPRE